MKQLGAQHFGTLSIADHDRRDRGLRAPQIKAEGPQALLKEVRIVPQLCHPVLGPLEELHCRNAGSDISGRGRAGKQIRPGTLLEIIDEYLASSHVAANHPKRLRERAHLDINLAEQAKVMT